MPDEYEIAAERIIEELTRDPYKEAVEEAFKSRDDEK